MDQPEMSLTQFQALFGTEEACINHLFSQRWPTGYACPRCGCRRYSFHTMRRLFQCSECKYQVSATAGTIFHKTRTPLIKWFWMIFLMTRQKSGVSMMSLQRMLDIKSYKTVWAMGHKIRKAMAERDAQYDLGGLIQAQAYLQDNVNRVNRQKEDESDTRLVVALETVDGKPRFAGSHKVAGADGRKALKGFGKGRRANSEIFRKTGGSQNGGARIAKSPGTTVKGVINELQWVQVLISNLKGNIRGVHHGVSVKHLERYLSEFLYRFNRRFWESQLFNRTVVACASTCTITFAELTQ